MMNFLLGTTAGGLIACVATIAAARHPEVQLRLGLVATAAPITLSTLPARVEPCAPAAAKGGIEAQVGQADMLFSRKRFWFVAP